MSGEIKFRIWDKANKEYMVLGATGLDARNGDVIDYYNEGNRLGGPEEYDVEQYTGLKDKNGKEIYEGDIVYDIYTGDEVFIVGWDKDKASFMLADTADYPMAYFDEYKLDKDLEVIGNIHENSELLGGKE